MQKGWHLTERSALARPLVDFIVAVRQRGIPMDPDVVRNFMIRRPRVTRIQKRLTELKTSIAF
jgi:hypothetical protein